MINYRAHTVEELATDEMFRRWVIDTTPEISLFWQKWIDENPDKSSTVGRARELVLAVHEIYKDDLSDEVLHHEIEEITRLAEQRKREVERNLFRSPVIWKVAAMLLLVSGLGLLYYSTSHSSRIRTVTAIPVVQKADSMHVRTNNGEGEMTVLLSDNSVATLAKGSTITFPKQFTSSERKVHLTGEAFFDVAKNPEKPFLVYTNETVTKVLGTSFRIKAFDQENTEMVLVKTGRVSVYPKKEYETNNGPAKTISGVVLNPNQQAVFIRNENRLEKGTVANPHMLTESVTQRELIFDDKPVAQVLESLEKVYGIVIVYDAQMLSECVISAQFNDESLKQRMNAICQAIGATYEMVNGQIVINSKGCS